MKSDNSQRENNPVVVSLTREERETILDRYLEEKAWRQLQHDIALAKVLKLGAAMKRAGLS